MTHSEAIDFFQMPLKTRDFVGQHDLPCSSIPADTLSATYLDEQVLHAKPAAI